MLKIIIFIVGIALGAIGSFYFTQPKSVDEVLEKTHMYLQDVAINQAITQSEMNEYSSMSVNIIDMRRRLLEKGEDSVTWMKMYTENLKEPSEFEGGSLAPLDLNFRAYDLQLQRVNALR